MLLGSCEISCIQRKGKSIAAKEGIDQADVGESTADRPRRGRSGCIPSVRTSVHIPPKVHYLINGQQEQLKKVILVAQPHHQD